MINYCQPKKQPPKVTTWASYHSLIKGYGMAEVHPDLSVGRIVYWQDVREYLNTDLQAELRATHESLFEVGSKEAKRLEQVYDSLRIWLQIEQWKRNGKEWFRKLQFWKPKPFSKFTFPTIGLPFPNLVATDVMNTQQMEGPTKLIFLLEEKYEKAKTQPT